MQTFVGNWNPEARAEHAQLFVVQLFLLVSDVLAFTGFAESITFNSLGKDQSRTALMVHRSAVSGMHFQWIMSAQPHARQLIIRKMLDHLQQAGIGAEQVLPEVSATLNKKFLILTVGDFTEA